MKLIAAHIIVLRFNRRFWQRAFSLGTLAWTRTAGEKSLDSRKKCIKDDFEAVEDYLCRRH